MNIKFTTALEAEKIVDDLKLQLKTINYNKDLKKLVANCDKLLNIFGSAEVKARQLHKPYLANKAREDLAQALNYLEKVIIIVKLTE